MRVIKTIFIILFSFLITSTLAIASSPFIPDPDIIIQPIEYDAAFFRLKSAKSIECYFPKGMLANWQGKEMALKEDQMSTVIHFDNIDVLDKKQARMIALNATDVRAFISPNGITFIEITDNGNFIYTTVFPSYLKNKKINSEPQKDSLLFQEAFIAVSSRHIYAPRIGAMPSQFHGYCRILE